MSQTFLQLKKNLKKDFSSLQKIRIALLGDTSTQFLNIALRGTGYEQGLNLDIWEADFNQIDQQVLDPSSELNSKKFDVVILFCASHKLLQKYNNLENAKRYQFAENELTRIEELIQTLGSNGFSKVIFCNYAEINDEIFGNFSNKIEHSFLYQLRSLNMGLMQRTQQLENLSICDLSTIQNTIGVSKMFSPAIYSNTDMVLSMESLPQISERILAIIKSQIGRMHKCLILDLDNTMWGGTIGDDGIERIEIGQLGIGKVFTEFQHWIKKLKERGIILAVCSKNTESIAKEPFEKHEEMVIRLDDISVFVANWENKADNIRYIKDVLNIGFDSMVFLDDNPFERNIVKENLPDVTVPDLPKDPSEYLQYLYTLNLFETSSYSKEDEERTLLYKKEAERKKLEKSMTNVGDFLATLAMESDVQEFNKQNLPRISQLSLRSNQFNLRTIRYTEEEIKEFLDSENKFGLSFTLDDKFGSNGLICVITLDVIDSSQVFIENWLMSCRVLKRGMERFVLNEIVKFCLKKGFKTLFGEYIRTEKNILVEDHYKDLGFDQVEDKWRLNLEEYQPINTFISIKQ